MKAPEGPVSLYFLPGLLEPVPLTTALLSLAPDIQTKVFTLLSPDDLGILSRCVEELQWLEDDKYLKKIWHTQTMPARVDFALFSPLHGRPSPEDLVRCGTLRGLAVISGVRNRGYWCSESAVRLSRIHAKLLRDEIRRHLTSALAPSTRPQATLLYAQRILPSASLSTSPSILARAYDLEKCRSRDQVKRALVRGRVGQRTLGEIMEGQRSLWADEGERVRWALCPGIREMTRYYEGLARAV